jgi:hypothetical protein
MKKILSFLARLFPSLFGKYAATAAAKTPTSSAPVAVATPVASNPIDRSTGLGTATIALLGGSTAGNGPVYTGPAPTSTYTPGVLVQGEPQPVHPGTNRFTTVQRKGQTVLVSTTDGHGTGQLSVYYSNGTMLSTQQIINGYSTLTWVADHDDVLTVIVVIDADGNVERQGSA